MEVPTRSADIQSLIGQAHLLLGKILVRELNGRRLAGKIVEVEAYHQSDPASHTYRGQTTTNAAMFGLPNRAYVYFTYGSHYCFNVTAGALGQGAGVLVRALEPLEGLKQMAINRFPVRVPNRDKTIANSPTEVKKLCSGPGKLAQALAIDKSFNGHDLTQPPLYIEKPKPGKQTFQIEAARRIGISRGVNELLRFYIKDSPYISHP